MSETIIFHRSDLLTYTKKIRLDIDKNELSRMMENNKKVEGDKLKFQDHLKNLWQGTKSAFQGEDDKKERVEKNEKAFFEKYKDVVPENVARSLVKETFVESKDEMAKLTFAISVILDNEFDWVFHEEGLKAVSDFLYGDPNKLLEVEKKFKTAFREISGIGLSEENKETFEIVGVLCLSGQFLLSMCSPIGAALSAGALAAKIAVETVLIGGMVLGIVAGVDELTSDARLQKEYREMSPDKEAMLLAVRSVYLSSMKENLSKEEFKKEVDETLKSLSMLKSDTDYYYYVEGEDLENNRKKEEIFHRFDNHLARILGYKDSSSFILS